MLDTPGVLAPRSDLVNAPARSAPSHTTGDTRPARLVSPLDDAKLQRLRASGRCHTRVAPDSPAYSYSWISPRCCLPLACPCAAPSLL